MLLYPQKFVREITFQKYEDCSKESLTHLDLKILKSNVTNIIRGSAEFTIAEKINGPILVSLDASRCSLDMQNCEKFMTYNFKQVCKKLAGSAILFKNVINAITPRLICPIVPGLYSVAESTIDVSVFALVPLDGYVYVINVKAVSGDKESSTRKMAFCYNMEAKVVKVRSKS
jgi:hypothetical protein